MQKLTTLDDYSEEKLLKALNLTPLFWIHCPKCKSSIPIFGNAQKDGPRIRSHSQNHSNPGEVEHALVTIVFQLTNKQMRERF